MLVKVWFGTTGLPDAHAMMIIARPVLAHRARGCYTPLQRCPGDPFRTRSNLIVGVHPCECFEYVGGDGASFDDPHRHIVIAPPHNLADLRCGRRARISALPAYPPRAAGLQDGPADLASRELRRSAQ